MYFSVNSSHQAVSSGLHCVLSSALSLHQVLMSGLQKRSVGETKIIPHLDTVAGEALLRFSTSNTILVLSDIGILSLLARVRILLSSSTVLRFSIQIASTGPSQTIQLICLLDLALLFFQISEKTPGTHSPYMIP